MPAGNGRGPMGAGPMTGRGAGFCAGYSAPVYVNPVRGGGSYGAENGMGQGSGRGRGSGAGSGSRRTGKGQGGGCGGRSGASLSGECLCLQCGTSIPHTSGVACNSIRCPKCGAMMVRKK